MTQPNPKADIELDKILSTLDEELEVSTQIEYLHGKFKADLQAWSRQQTEGVLTELKRRHQMPLTHPYLTSNGSREILAVPVVYIDEKLAAIASAQARVRKGK